MTLAGVWRRPTSYRAIRRLRLSSAIAGGGLKANRAWLLPPSYGTDACTVSSTCRVLGTEQRPQKKSFARSAVGQSLPKCDVRITSAFPPIATEWRTFRVGSFGPKSDFTDIVDLCNYLPLKRWAAGVPCPKFPCQRVGELVENFYFDRKNICRSQLWRRLWIGSRYYG
jgi:hypothetical protein